MEGRWHIVLALAIVCCVLNNVQSATWEEDFQPEDFEPELFKSSSRSGKVINLKKWGNGYTLKEVVKTTTGKVTKFKYNEMYKGIDVVGGSVVLEKHPNGSFTDFAFGQLVRNIEKDLDSVTPKISTTKALEIAKTYQSKITSEAVRSSPKPTSKNNTKAAKESATARLSRRVERSPEQPIVKPKTTTLIYIDTEKKNKAVLVYHIEYLIENEEFASKPSYLINAITGQMIKYWDDIGLYQYKMQAYAGNEKIGKYRYGSYRWAARKLDVDRISPFSSQCRMQNARAKLINCHHSYCSPYSSAYITSCYGTNDGDNGAYSQAADAFWFTTAVEKMYNVWYGDDTIYNTYGRISVRVHYGYNYVNAFWNGQCITFGDATTYGRFLPFTSADVTSHELAHAFTSATSNLWYWGQSGGINEAFSDMAGEAFKNYLRGSNDWNLGYDIMRKEDALRFMKHPPKDGKSIQCARNFHNQNVHYTSGVYNKAFYILANKPGWCVRTAFAVFVRANKVYWNYVTSYNRGACGVRQAAIDLGYKPEDVDDAFAQVGVFCKCPPGFIKRNDWSCYKFVKDVASWSESKVHCESIGAKLVAIEDYSEQYWIESYIKSHSSVYDHFMHQNADFWIGGTDVASEGTWKWASTGNSVLFTRWFPGEPNNEQKHENCMALERRFTSWSSVSAYFRYGWYDEDCYLKKFYICEKSC